MAWEDKEGDWTPCIVADHPARSGAYDTYDTAMKLVGNRHSKGALVALVNHLLLKIERAKKAPNPEAE